MGGLALKKYGILTERKSTADFYKIGTIISKIFENDLGVETFIPFFYREKETHGDLDLLIKIDDDFINKKIDLRKYILSRFNLNIINKNGGYILFLMIIFKLISYQ